MLDRGAGVKLLAKDTGLDRLLGIAGNTGASFGAGAAMACWAWAALEPDLLIFICLSISGELFLPKDG